MSLQRRPLLAALVLTTLGGLALAACGTPRRAPPSTLRSPSSLAALQWCSQLDGSEVVAAPVTDDCADNADRRVVVANRGTREVHLLEIDEREPFLLDTDRATPGINGLRVGNGPVAVASTPTPALAVVVSEREPALAFVDGAFRRVVQLDVGGTVTDRLPLAGPAGHVVVTADARVAWTQPVDRTIATATYSFGCGDGELLRSDCEPRVTLQRDATIALPGTPAHVALHPDGNLWVSLAESPHVVVVSLDGSDAHCQGVACIVRTISIAGPCADGLDNDGDGLTDADDPQCYGPDDDETGALFDDSTAACGDNLDNDGDGLTDADDPDCHSQGGTTESAYNDATNCANGADDDLDGLADADDPQCGEGSGEFAEAVAAAASPLPPVCADGDDNDGDGLTDAEDPDCYGASGTSEAPPALPVAGRIAALADGDYVLIVDVTSPQLLVYDAHTYARVDVNGPNRLRTGRGISIPQRLPTAIATDAIAVFDAPMTDGRRLQITDRVAHVATTGGQAHTFDIDRTFEVVDSLGNVLQREVELLFRRRDASPAAADVRSVSCTLPNSIFAALGVVSLGCGDERLPGLAVADEEAADVEATSWVSQPGPALVTLPGRTTWTLNEDSSAVEPLELNDEYRIAGDSFEITWEGVLPEAWRNDVVFVGPSEIRALGTEPCGAFDNVCSSALEIAECPELEELCLDGVDVCDAGIDVCAVCPQLCSTAVDFCAAGVVAGDTVVLSPPDRAPDSSGQCTGSDAGANTSTTRWEYRVVAVRPDTLTLELLGTDDPRLTPAAASVIPSADCWDRPFTAEVRAGDAWVLEGRRAFGHPSPRVGLDGQCVFRDDAHVRNGRPRTDELFVSEFGMAFTIEPGTLAPYRDYAISFNVTSGFANREARTRQFLLGPATSDMLVINSQRGRRVVFADEAQDYVWIYSALTFLTSASPIP